MISSLHRSAPYHSTRSMVMLSACLITMLACENEIDTTANILPTSPIAGDSMSGEVVQEGCMSCVEVGAWYRFTTLQLNSIDGGSHPVIPVLNNLWAGDVEAHSLNVFFEIKAMDGDQIKIGAMNAAWVSEEEDDYCLLPETAIEFIFTQSECSIANSEPAGINIYAGSQEIPKNCSPEGEAQNAIPVRDVLLEADFTEDCAELINGSVRSAAIKRSALEETCSCLSPVIESCQGIDPNFEGNMFGECGGCNTRYNSLSRQLNTFQPLTWECQVDGEQAVCLEASFDARRLSFTPSVCP